MKSETMVSTEQTKWRSIRLDHPQGSCGSGSSTSSSSPTSSIAKGTPTTKGTPKTTSIRVTNAAIEDARSSCKLVSGSEEVDRWSGQAVWECSVDLARYLMSEEGKRLLDGARGESESGERDYRSTSCYLSVLELGCGHALPSIALALASGKVRLTLQDYDPAVLETVTKANVVENLIKENDDSSFQHQEDVTYLPGTWEDMLRNNASADISPCQGRSTTGQEQEAVQVGVLEEWGRVRVSALSALNVVKDSDLPACDNPVYDDDVISETSSSCGSDEDAEGDEGMVDEGRGKDEEEERGADDPDGKLPEPGEETFLEFWPIKGGNADSRPHPSTSSTSPAASATSPTTCSPATPSNTGLPSPQEEETSTEFSDVILCSEGIYKEETFPVLYKLLLAKLRPKTGIALFAGKKFYFGCGGGTRLFADYVRSQQERALEVEVLQEIKNKKSNIREILLLRWKDIDVPSTC
ncbi:unnamed protein product [Amoebophrya sp. A25]|nr:unnamed protein product [Amoebophrya sp. A25]|eukprot:GSA25T00010273001.1